MWQAHSQGLRTRGIESSSVVWSRVSKWSVAKRALTHKIQHSRKLVGRRERDRRKRRGIRCSTIGAWRKDIRRSLGTYVVQLFPDCPVSSLARDRIIIWVHEVHFSRAKQKTGQDKQFATNTKTVLFVRLCDTWLAN